MWGPQLATSCRDEELKEAQAHGGGGRTPPLQPACAFAALTRGGRTPSTPRTLTVQLHRAKGLALQLQLREHDGVVSEVRAQHAVLQHAQGWGTRAPEGGAVRPPQGPPSRPTAPELCPRPCPTRATCIALSDRWTATSWATGEPQVTLPGSCPHWDRVPGSHHPHTLHRESWGPS